MQFFGTPQRIAKKRSIGDTPMYPVCALAELSQGSGVNIVYIKLCRGANNAPRLSVAKMKCIPISPIEFRFLYVERLPMDLRIFCFIQNRDLSDFGRGIYFVFLQISFRVFLQTARRADLCASGVKFRPSIISLEPCESSARVTVGVHRALPMLVFFAIL